MHVSLHRRGFHRLSQYVLAIANNRQATGVIGAMQSGILFTGLAYLAGGVLFSVALFRANVLARWASALLAVGTLSSIGAGIVPEYERLFAIPTGLALVGLGYSLWRAQRTSAALPTLNPVSSAAAPKDKARYDRQAGADGHGPSAGVSSQRLGAAPSPPPVHWRAIGVGPPGMALGMLRLTTIGRRSELPRVASSATTRTARTSSRWR